MSMETWVWVVIGIVVLGVLALAITSGPDLVRYLKIKNM